MDVATSALDVTRIHRGDVVTCPQCGKSGEVDCDDGEAFISWSEPEACPRCGTKSARPNGEHYCHSKEQSGMTNNNLTDERIAQILEAESACWSPEVLAMLRELQYSRRKLAELDAVVEQRNGECVRLHKELGQYGKVGPMRNGLMRVTFEMNTGIKAVFEKEELETAGRVVFDGTELDLEMMIYLARIVMDSTSAPQA